MPKIDPSNLVFPSGRKVGQVKRDAKRLLKQLKSQGHNYSLHSVQNHLARENGVELDWPDAIRLLAGQNNKEHHSVSDFLTGWKNQYTAMEEHVFALKGLNDDSNRLQMTDEGGEPVFGGKHKGKGILISDSASNYFEPLLSLIEHREAVEIKFWSQSESLNSYVFIVEKGVIARVYVHRTEDSSVVATYLHSSVEDMFGMNPIDSFSHWNSMVFWLSAASFVTTVYVDFDIEESDKNAISFSWPDLETASLLLNPIS